jgi:hypothetical protein
MESNKQKVRVVSSAKNSNRAWSSKQSFDSWANECKTDPKQKLDIDRLVRKGKL